MLTIYCLCAAWCRTCDEYAGSFDAFKEAFQNKVQWVWVDIEDHADLIDEVDVENFPTLLVTDPRHVYFFGPVLPHPSVSTQLVERVLDGKLQALTLPAVAALHQRFMKAPWP